MRTFFAFITLIILLLSCDDGLIFSEHKELESELWSYDSSISFSFSAPDTTIYYQLVLDVEHSADFSYENFYTRITTKFPSGNSATDDVSIQLADKMGSWLGQCNSSSCTTEILLQESFRFREIGQHQLVFENFSRVPLEGIQGLHLEIYRLGE